MVRCHPTNYRHYARPAQQQFLMRAKWCNLVLDCSIPDAYPNRHAQQIQVWKNCNANTINNHHDTLWRQQVLSLRPLYHLSWIYPLPLFLLHGQHLPTMELSQITESQKRFSNRRHHPTCQSHLILLAYQREALHPPHHPILCS